VKKSDNIRTSWWLQNVEIRLYYAVLGLYAGNMFSTDETSEILTTAVPDHHQWPVYWGFVAIAVASVLFGSNLIPIKKFETGDGM